MHLVQKLISSFHLINLCQTSIRSVKPSKKGEGSDFSYLGKSDPLLIEAWRPGQPNASRGYQCLFSYLGLEPNASSYIKMIDVYLIFSLMIL